MNEETDHLDHTHEDILTPDILDETLESAGGTDRQQCNCWAGSMYFSVPV